MAEEATLPAYFPRVAKECKAVSKEFFDCFSNESKYAPGLDPKIGQVALQKCKASLDTYKACSEKHLKHRQLIDAPQSYTEQVKQGDSQPR